MTNLSTKFDFCSVEKKWCSYWEDNEIFHAEPDIQKDPYSIVIPPPNVTGILHMGHALNNTLQDIIIRYKRMKGFNACWMPGTDHAGIATQNVVEKSLAKEGKTRYDIGRDEMNERLWAWKEEYGGTILNQLRRLGASCDWTRTRFTMDDHYSQVVRHVFVHLYEKGIVYRGQYIINWCPRCQTALSDEEAEHHEQQGTLYHIRYPFHDNDQEYVVVATTRPETMLGDTAVAVHPEDERYKHLIGKKVVLPIINRTIPIIADEFVDPEFGTGAVKVTPAHDPNDFEIGRRHNLEFINIMHPDGRLNEQAGGHNGEDRFEAREAILEELKGLKVLEKVDAHTHAVGHCYRCHSVVEPYLSKQWFVKMQPLAEPAVQVVKDKKVKFYPQRWTKVYLHWMENIRDWCISRQIWWGHRIPVWYCADCPEGENIIVAHTTPGQCPKCQGSKLKQDEDVLDTWFSSWLWPFATFGWPQSLLDDPDKPDIPFDFSKADFHCKEGDVNYFYPSNSLFTASEIIFFWVARMIMAGLEFVGDIPFSDVYIHGTVRDSKGRKMSKSLGNAIDPVEIIEEFGADALRFSLIINSGLDLYISKDKFEIGRNFANKIWNASRLVLLNTKLEKRQINLKKNIDLNKLDLPSRWIISRFHSTLNGVEQAIESYRYSEAENLLYDFFWKNFCDWYLEIIKDRMDDENIQKIVFSILEQSIRMLHPFVPFVTEEIWGHLNVAEGCLALQSWPDQEPELIDPAAEKDMNVLLDTTTTLRNIKSQWNIKPQQAVDCIFVCPSAVGRKLIEDNAATIQFMLKIKDLKIFEKDQKITDSAMGLVEDIKFYLPLGDLIDVAKEKTRISEQIKTQSKAMDGLAKRLNNKSFLDKAPPEVVEKEKQRLESLKIKIQELNAVVKNLG